jgi:two-component system, chemotaxis family, chemotaxis protein CheY
LRRHGAGERCNGNPTGGAVGRGFYRECARAMDCQLHNLRASLQLTIFSTDADSVLPPCRQLRAFVRCFDPSHGSATGGTPTRTAAAQRNRTMALDFSMPILVVDDYSTMVSILRNLLRQIGFRDIDAASDGPAALGKMRAKRYGLIISDWNMEPMTGYELLKQIREDPSLARTPFIMITAESKTQNVIAAKKAGVDNYIVKPFNAQTLHSKIEAVFAD